jgi:hypothetical protein
MEGSGCHMFEIVTVSSQPSAVSCQPSAVSRAPGQASPASDKPSLPTPTPSPAPSLSFSACPRSACRRLRLRFYTIRSIVNPLSAITITTHDYHATTSTSPFKPSPADQKVERISQGRAQDTCSYSYFFLHLSLLPTSIASALIHQQAPSSSTTRSYLYLYLQLCRRLCLSSVCSTPFGPPRASKPDR